MKIEDDILVALVKDLEDTRDIYHGYAYIKTIKNILIGNNKSIIAPCFQEKSYYGICRSATRKDIKNLMDNLVEKGKLYADYRDKKVLYCTEEYLAELCKK